MAGQSYYNPVNGPSYMSGAPMYTQAYGVPAMPAYQMPVSSAPATVPAPAISIRNLNVAVNRVA